MKKKHNYKIPLQAAILAVTVAGGIYADHQVETLWATYDVKAIERTSWADYQDYLTMKAQRVEQASAHAVAPAPKKHTHVSAIPTPPTPAKFAQADQLGIFIKGR